MGEHKMNVKTIVKTAPKTAQNKGSFISQSYQILAWDNGLAQMPCKNSPRKSVYSSDVSKPTNAQIVAELNYARCVFQLETIRTVMGVQNDTSCADISERQEQGK